MSSPARPVVVAYDGSAESQVAVRTAAGLFPTHRLVITSVWEPGLAMAMAAVPDPTGIGYVPPTGEAVASIDRAQRDHAVAVAEEGVRLAQESGAAAEAYPVADEVDVARTLAEMAVRLEAGAIVVGSRGLGGIKSKLLGSTSAALLHHASTPVLVVRAPH